MISAFNDDGQDRWLELLNNLKDDPAAVLKGSRELAENPKYIEQIAGEFTLQKVVKRLDFAIIIDNIIQQNSLQNRTGDPKFWNWMAAFWLQQLVSDDPRVNIRQKLGASTERWALTDGSLRYHRHLVSSPYFAYVDNNRDVSIALCLLSTPVLEPGEVVERISGKKAFATGNLCALATRLYVDPATQNLKPRVTSPPGHPKGFSRFFGQLDKNVDYRSLTVDELLEILPESFDKWKV